MLLLLRMGVRSAKHVHGDGFGDDDPFANAIAGGEVSGDLAMSRLVRCRYLLHGTLTGTIEAVRATSKWFNPELLEDEMQFCPQRFECLDHLRSEFTCDG